MILHRFDAQDQPFGHRRVAVPLGDQLQYLALAHRGKTDPNTMIGRQADAVIANFDAQARPTVRVDHGEPNAAGAGLGVAHDVRQCFQRNAVGRKLDGGRQRRQRLRRLHQHLEVTATRNLGRVFADGRQQSQLIQRCGRSA